MDSQDIPSAWPTDIPYDPNRRRYYLVDADLHGNPSDFELLNEEEVFPLTAPAPDGRRHPVKAGAREYQIPGRARPDTYGLPRLRAKPRVFVGRRGEPLDSYGFDQVRYVSTRAKELLCSIDAEAFELVECETRSREGVEVEPYWMITVIRLVDAFDEERSVFEWSEGVNGLTNVPYRGPYFSRLYDIHMLPTLGEDIHAFFFPRYWRNFVFDQVLVDAWRAQTFSGLVFTPLQPPAPWERSVTWFGGDNLRYWYHGKYRR
jgi:Protein of unknown function (DUF1629)